MTDSPIVTLRGQRSDDWDSLYNLLKKPNAVRFGSELPHISEDTFRDRYTNSAPGLHRLIGEITLPSGRNRFVGMAQIQLATWRRRHTAQLELALMPDYYASDAEASFLSQAIDFAERWLGIHRIQTVIYVEDEKSITLYENHGFQCEATMRNYALRDGAFRDACLMSRVSVPTTETKQDADLIEAKPVEPGPAAHPETSDEITVRGAESNDWEDVAEILQSESVYTNTLQLPYLSRDEVRERYENPPDGVRTLAAEIDEQVVGVLGLHFDPERRTHTASLGMVVHKDYQGRGVGTTLVQAAIELCEQWLNINRIELEVYLDNAPGIALYHKWGFEIEGTLRAYAYRAGQYVDAYLMARVQEAKS